MTPLLVPAAVDTTSASVWVGVADDAVRGRIEVEHQGSGRRQPLETWQRWSPPDASGALHFTRTRFERLTAGMPQIFTLRVDGQPRTAAAMATLPLTLPPVTSPPFTVLVGSCYSVLADGGGQVGRAFLDLPGALTPQLKMLVGDQVYLDSPWYRFLLPQPAGRLAQGFLRHYLTTWGQRGDRHGFAHLLSHGANFFCPDDHEFWNNVPFPSSAAVNTWRAEGRRAWQTLADSLYRAFQDEAGFVSLTIGELAACVIDTRRQRTRDRSQFTARAVMDRFAAWVGALTGPGLVMLSQPIFATRAGRAGRFIDWNLPDFAQYADLCRVLLASRQSLLLACGDVHFGRIARATLPSGADLIEVVSSPLALVSGAGRSAWQAAPPRFPAEPIAGLASVRVTTAQAWRVTDDHFVTLHFHAVGGGVRCEVRAWPIAPTRRPAAPPAVVVALHTGAA